ncbi:hypothetical protein SBD_7839 [Streptomyces bottropensis ATCC 25435]|uniref:Uncharacterized protein n=1 Tax=Streptomyces bottropensis ATCC 25435 TaxID=1054862 RepID=M3D4N8_9ACTN|nr:hypothetical protein SBD_7839 [Streptomyces bottropensis ATCC 25435]
MFPRWRVKTWGPTALSHGAPVIAGPLTRVLYGVGAHRRNRHAPLVWLLT